MQIGDGPHLVSESKEVEREDDRRLADHLSSPRLTHLTPSRYPGWPTSHPAGSQADPLLLLYVTTVLSQLWSEKHAMSHHISTEPLYLYWATTSPLSHYISTEPPHLHWATTSPLSRQISNGPLYFNWATISPLSHHISTEPLYLHWATTSRASSHIFTVPLDL